MRVGKLVLADISKKIYNFYELIQKKICNMYIFTCQVIVLLAVSGSILPHAGAIAVEAN
jgi:hypothetical protein